MNKCSFLIIIMFCFCSFHSVSGREQGGFTVEYDSITQLKVYSFVEKMPEYIGSNSFAHDFSKYFKYDASKFKNEPIQTVLMVQYVIDSVGYLIGARILNKKAADYTDFEKAGIKALNFLQNWQPGETNGKSVNIKFTQRINVDFNR